MASQEVLATCFLCRQTATKLCDVGSGQVVGSQISYAQCMSELVTREFSCNAETPVKICEECCGLFDQRAILRAHLRTLEDKLTSLITSRLDEMSSQPRFCSAEEMIKYCLPVEYSIEEDGVKHCMVTIKDEMGSDMEELEPAEGTSNSSLEEPIASKTNPILEESLEKQSRRAITKRINIIKPKTSSIGNVSKKTRIILPKPDSKKTPEIKNSTSMLKNNSSIESDSLEISTNKSDAIATSSVTSTCELVTQSDTNLNNLPANLAPSFTLQTATGQIVLQKLGNVPPVAGTQIKTLASLITNQQFVTSDGKILNPNCIKKIIMAPIAPQVTENVTSNLSLPSLVPFNTPNTFKLSASNVNLPPDIVKSTPNASNLTPNLAIPSLVPFKTSPNTPKSPPDTVKFTSNSSLKLSTPRLIPFNTSSNVANFAPDIAELSPNTLDLPPDIMKSFTNTSNSILKLAIPRLVPFKTPPTANSAPNTANSAPDIAELTPDTTQFSPNTQIVGTLTNITESSNNISNQNKETALQIDKTKQIVYQCKNCKLMTTDKNFIKNIHKCMATKNKCQICNYVANTLKELRQHLRDEHQMCSECNQKFPSNTSLMEHLKTHTKTVQSILPKPPSNWEPIGSVTLARNKPIERKIETSNHIKITKVKSTNLLSNYCTIYEINKIYATTCCSLSNQRKQCILCKVVLKNQLDFDRHFLVHLHESIPCKYCRVTLTNYKFYLTHMLYHEIRGKKSLICNECGEKVYRLQGLKLHMRTKHNLHYECNECNEQFMTSGLLQKHIDEHTNSTFFQCDHCHSSFPNRELLKQHLQTHTTKDEGGVCITCGKICKTAHKLIIHEKTHITCTYPCTICNKILKTERSLVSHMKIHNNEYKYRCKYCDKGCISIQAKKEHENNVHMQEKQNFYTCKICNKEFRHYGSYNRHIKWHDDPYPGKCTLCGYKSRYKHLIDIHTRTVHTKETYDCTLCDKKYFAKYLLKRHMAHHTGKYPYKCEDCNKGWNIKSHFRMHKYKVHNIPLPEKKIKTKDDYKIVIPDLPASIPGIPPQVC